MENLAIYNKYREVPEEAKKPIKGGRLSGFTDINPMWRIKSLTEQFGPIGKGWYYEVVEEKIEEGGNGEKVGFVKINLFVKYDEEWSKPIVGNGGSSFVAKERNGLYTSDECFKMATTDALGVACKLLGIGANVYWDKDRSKYDQLEQGTDELSNARSKPRPNQNNNALITPNQGNELIQLMDLKKVDLNFILNYNKVKSLDELTQNQYTGIKKFLASK